MTLKKLEELSGCRVQSIGMAFDLIEPALKRSGIGARKCGTPVRIQLSYIQIPDK